MKTSPEKIFCDALTLSDVLHQGRTDTPSFIEYVFLVSTHVAKLIAVELFLVFFIVTCIYENAACGGLACSDVF